MLDRVEHVVSGASNSGPLPIFSGGGGAIVLLPLIEPTESAGVLAALRAEFPELPVTARSLTLDALAALGPLAGRLDEARASGESE